MPWKPGQSGNPKGRPPIDRSKAKDKMYKALQAEARKRGTTFEAHVAEQAFKDNTVLGYVIKTQIPQLKAVEVKGEMFGPAAIIQIDLGDNGGEKMKALTGGAVVKEPFKLLNQETEFPEPS